MSLFATGVTVITGTTSSGDPVGLTVNAFTSVSLDPPLVLVCLDKNTGCIEAFSEGEEFAVNILREDQKSLSDMFAGPQKYKFRDLNYETWKSGCPILTECLANLECVRVNLFDAGDHLIILGKVERIKYSLKSLPLLYHKSKYCHLRYE